jgi:glycosyltransferase involved in cell wall biosynthesis
MLNIASRWRGDSVDVQYGVLRGDTYATGPLEILARLIRWRFDTRDREWSTSGVGARLVDFKTGTAPAAELERDFDGFLLPEPSLVGASVELARRLVRGQRPVPFFVYYDALPLTHPHGFRLGAPAELAFNRYYRALLPASNIAFISRRARETFEQRLARASSPGSITLELGADGIGRAAMGECGSKPQFTMVGTVEPRKRHRVVLEAFQRLWDAGRDYELVLLGARGWESPETFSRIKALQRTGKVRWLEHAPDSTVEGTIATSTAVVFVPEAEGYGLPALEALALGCPVVASADLPSLEGIDDAGQLRLDQVDGATLTKAIDDVADPQTNAHMRAALRDLSLPTWEKCIGDVERWIGDTLDVAKSQ